MISNFLNTLGFLGTSQSVALTQVSEMEIKNFETLEQGTTLTWEDAQTKITFELPYSQPSLPSSLTTHRSRGRTQVHLIVHKISYMEYLVSISDWVALLLNHPHIQIVSLVEDLAPTVLEALAATQSAPTPAPEVALLEGQQAPDIPHHAAVTPATLGPRVNPLDTRLKKKHTPILPSLRLFHLHFIDFDRDKTRVPLPQFSYFDAILSLVTHRQLYGAKCAMDIDYTRGFNTEMLQRLEDVVGPNAATWDGLDSDDWL